MFTTTYLIRLDDACPFMDRAKWRRIEDILDKHGVKPLLGIIPDNADDYTMIDTKDDSFGAKVQSWVDKGWTMALHGYDHCYIAEGGMDGLNPMWKRSEFAGVPLEKEREKIRKGVAILREYGINPKYFFAPSHTFDENTLIALREESDIRFISDTIALKPYMYKDFLFVPQIMGSVRDIPFPCVHTFCYHPNTMCDGDFEKLDAFLTKNKAKFTTFDDVISRTWGRKTMIDKLLSSLFFSYRRLRKMQ